MKAFLDLPANIAGGVWYLHGREQASYAVHHHEELELNLVTQGRGTYLLRGTKYGLSPGDAIWLFPAQDHVLLDQSPDFAMWIIVWKPDIVAHSSTLTKNKLLTEADPAGNFHRRLSEGAARRLSVLCEELREADIDCSNAGLPYLLLRAWEEFNATGHIAVGQDVHPCVEQAARLLRDGDDLGLPALARKVGLSPSRLSRLFKEQSGVSLSEFRNRQRLERFFRAFGTGQRRSLSEAALEAGFGSYPQFHRIFKQHTGQSPASLKRNEFPETRCG